MRMRSLGRRRLLKSAGAVVGGSLIAGLPVLFPLAYAEGPPPRPTQKSKKTVSEARPPTDKRTKKTDKRAEQTNKNGRHES